MTTYLDGTDEYFDSRDVDERISELVTAWEEATGDEFDAYNLSEEDYAVGLSRSDAETLSVLIEFRDEVQSTSREWFSGITFVADGDVDHTAFEFQGVTYWARA
jgi:hypothetical protein